MPSNEALHQSINKPEPAEPCVMWNPQPDKMNNMKKFMFNLNQKYGIKLGAYRDLWKWSIENYDKFWEEMWQFADIISSKPYSSIVDTSLSIADIPEWFHGARMNYAENLLRYKDDRIALIGAGEGQSIRKLSYSELHKQVSHYASALKKLEVKTGDRVVGYIPNCIEAVIAMLATASIGAIWSSTSPDFGVTGVLDRFHQIEPKIVFSVEAVHYNGKRHPHLTKLEKVSHGLPGLQHVVVIPFASDSIEELDISSVPKSMTLSEFLENGSSSEPLQFEQLPFNHPLFVMYSSGTTGPPKCMVHSAGGTLIQHMKEHILHGNMNRDDIMLYYTTAGWMMWNWLVGSLTSGGAIVLYDGSPFLPKSSVLFDLIDELGITILGTSAKCLDVLEEKEVKPRESHELKKLHTILSTGSPLTPHQYDYVYQHIKPDVLLGSITGGTDIISCFISQNCMVPVHRGELQAANLGMGVYCYEEDEEGVGRSIYGQPGELVCTKPFPSMPVYFWNDKDGILYKKAYFSKFPGVWSHGDFCLEDERTHGFVMLGRSDATLNPNGVRFGTSELYTIMENEFRKEIVDSLAAAQRPKITFDDKPSKKNNERVVLFVKMASGVSFDEELGTRIKRTIRSLLSPRHVPDIVMETKDIPYTISGKKVEVAITKILAGMDIKHTGAFRNPESLDLYRNIPALQGY